MKIIFFLLLKYRKVLYYLKDALHKYIHYVAEVGKDYNEYLL